MEREAVIPDELCHLFLW